MIASAMKICFFSLFSLTLWILSVHTEVVAKDDVSKLDSLKYNLEAARDDSLRILTMIEISKEYSLHDLSMALRYAERGLEAARATRNPYLISSALSNIGFVCFQHGLLELAAKHYYEFRDLHKSMNEQDGVLRGMINIAAIKLMMQDFEGTRDDLLEILDLIEELDAARVLPDAPPRIELSAIYNNLGVAYENMGDKEEAIDYYLRGISIARRMPGQEFDLARLLNNLGKVYAEIGRSSEAREVLNEALQIRLELNDRHGQASSYRNLARFHFDREDYESALEYSYQGLNIAERLGSLQLLINFTSLLFEHFDFHNQPDSALKYHKQLTEYSDRLKSEEVRQEITRMEITSQFQERELLREVEQKRKEQRYMFAGGFALLIAVILGLLFFLTRSRARRLQLANENFLLESERNQLERQNLENELEIKNKELTTNVMYQIRKNELINEISQKLLHYSHGLNREQQELIKGIIRDLEKTQDESVLQEFEVRFHQVHNDFYDKLHEINPDLSLNERRLCAFLRLNMTTKEISSITGQSLRSIEVARTRLRKKLHLTNSDANLTDYLLSI
ncbi:MAG: tetratricopeptide repeat protein [Bacteroidia bacterium]|nr:MAG: tetratricopeptide repeat protein [Bacteroidia bacterium]